MNVAEDQLPPSPSYWPTSFRLQLKPLKLVRSDAGTWPCSPVSGTLPALHDTAFVTANPAGPVVAVGGAADELPPSSPPQAASEAAMMVAKAMLPIGDSCVVRIRRLLHLIVVLGDARDATRRNCTILAALLPCYPALAISR